MIGKIVLRHRALIGIILLAITAYAGYETSRVRIGTSFVDFFPRTHPNVELYHEFERYGGAQTLTVMVEVKRGDIFNTNTPSTSCRASSTSPSARWLPIGLHTLRPCQATWYRRPICIPMCLRRRRRLTS